VAGAVESATFGGPAAERSEEPGPVQDVRTMAAAMMAARRLKGALFVMPDRTTPRPCRFPDLSGGHPLTPRVC
jgi:hypothetical protein